MCLSCLKTLSEGLFNCPKKVTKITTDSFNGFQQQQKTQAIIYIFYSILCSSSPIVSISVNDTVPVTTQNITALQHNVKKCMWRILKVNISVFLFCFSRAASSDSDRRRPHVLRGRGTDHWIGLRDLWISSAQCHMVRQTGSCRESFPAHARTAPASCPDYCWGEAALWEVH